MPVHLFSNIFHLSPCCRFFLLYLFIFNWKIIALQYCVCTKLLCSQYCVDFCICQHESATGTHMPPSSGTSLTPPTSLHPLVVTEHRFELPASYGKFPLAICVTYGSIYVSVLQALIQMLPSQWDLSWPFNLKFQLSSKVSYWYSFCCCCLFLLTFPYILLI